MTGTPPYIVRTGTPGENEEPAEDLESAIGIAAESIGSAVDPVEIVDSTAGSYSISPSWSTGSRSIGNGVAP